MSIADRIKRWRNHLGMTQGQLAAASGIPKATLVGYENAQREPGAAALAALGKTGCDLTWLVTGEGEMSRGSASLRDADDLIAEVTSDPYLRWFLAQDGHWPRQINGLLGALRHMPLVTLREGLASLSPGWRSLARSAFVDDLSRRVAELEQLADRVARLEAQVNPAPPAAAPASGSPWAPII